MLVRSGGADSDDSALPPTADNVETAAVGNAESTSYADASETKVKPGGDCHCAEGSELFWDRQADPGKVVVFLNGGGVCWDARTCAFTSENRPGGGVRTGAGPAGGRPGRRPGQPEQVGSGGLRCGRRWVGWRC